MSEDNEAPRKDKKEKWETETSMMEWLRKYGDNISSTIVFIPLLLAALVWLVYIAWSALSSIRQIIWSLWT